MSRYIDFDNPQNQDTYTGRDADPEWTDAFQRWIVPGGRVVVDVGCGGGIYLKAVAGLSPSQAIGVDSSAVSLRSARRYLGLADVVLSRGDAERIPIRTHSIDCVVERALIHHLEVVDRNFDEVFRILRQGGSFWLQDRTVDDVAIPPSDENLRGKYLTYVPRLMAIERTRRRQQNVLTGHLRRAGFGAITCIKLAELRKVFDDADALHDEIMTRRGRSILHQLSDRELRSLARQVIGSIAEWPVRERDVWTVWIARKSFDRRADDTDLVGDRARCHLSVGVKS